MNTRRGYKKNTYTKRNKNKTIRKNRNNKNKQKKIKSRSQGGGSNVSVDQASNINPNQQWDGPASSAPPAPVNGGLYSGEAAKGPWGSIPVTPTTSNYINNNLKSANPPPGATEQYPGNPRLGNNHQGMNGVKWYSDTLESNQGPFALKCTGGKKSKSKVSRKRKVQRKLAKSNNRRN